MKSSTYLNSIGELPYLSALLSLNRANYPVSRCGAPYTPENSCCDGMSGRGRYQGSLPCSKHGSEPEGKRDCHVFSTATCPINGRHWVRGSLTHFLTYFTQERLLVQDHGGVARLDSAQLVDMANPNSDHAGPSAFTKKQVLKRHDLIVEAPDDRMSICRDKWA